MNIELDPNAPTPDGQDDIIIEADTAGTDEDKSDDTPEKYGDDDKPDEKPAETDDDKSGTGTEAEAKKEDAVQKRINKVIFEKKTAEENLAKETAARAALEQQLADATKEVLPEVPPIPDVMDPEFTQKMADRDELIVKHAKDSAAKAGLLQLQADKANAAHAADAELTNTMFKTFDERTVELKLDKETLVDSQNKVGQFIAGKKDLARYLLSAENGPLNVLYLSQHVEELEKISKMPETDAAVYIATKVAPEAEKLKPKTTNTPDPHYVPSGKGKIETEDPNLEGCTFE